MGGKFIGLVIWLGALTALFVPLERLCAVHPRAARRGGLFIDLGYYFLTGLLPSVLLAIPAAALAACAQRAVPPWWSAGLAGLPVGVRLALALVVGDIGAYWGHRLSHRVPLLWRFHAIHHAATELDWLVHTRAHPLDVVFVRLCGMTPVFMLGLAAPGSVGGWLAALGAFASVVWGFAIHANLRWRFGVLESCLATPFFHHWHHSRHAPLDRNFAAMFPWIDRLFGTLHLPAAWPQAYGTDMPTPRHWVPQLLGPFWPGRARPARRSRIAEAPGRD